MIKKIRTIAAVLFTMALMASCSSSEEPQPPISQEGAQLEQQLTELNPVFPGALEPGEEYDKYLEYMYDGIYVPQYIIATPLAANDMRSYCFASSSHYFRIPAKGGNYSFLFTASCFEASQIKLLENVKYTSAIEQMTHGAMENIILMRESAKVKKASLKTGENIDSDIFGESLSTRLVSTEGGFDLIEWRYRFPDNNTGAPRIFWLCYDFKEIGGMLENVSGNHEQEFKDFPIVVMQMAE